MVYQMLDESDEWWRSHGAAQKLDDPDALKAALAAFHAVFRTTDTFGTPFTAHVESRIILYLALTPVTTSAVVAAAAALGETTAYFSQIEDYQGPDLAAFMTTDLYGDDDPEQRQRRHWLVDLSANSYPLVPDVGLSMTDTAVYSTRGTWGVLVSFESFAVAGGSRQFMDALKAALPGLDEQAVAFCRRYAPVEMLPTLLDHLYGPMIASRLLAEAAASPRSRPDAADRVSE
jgi:hypothetical protein